MNFVLDSGAFAQDPTCVNVAGVPIPGYTRHLRRNARGVAVGDLDGSGFADIVTVADVVSAPPLPVTAPAPATSRSTPTRGPSALGKRYRGTLEFLWLGGGRNRLIGVRAGEQLTVPGWRPLTSLR